MMRAMRTLLAAALLLCAACAARSTPPPPAETSAGLACLGFLSGTWRGHFDVETTEEIWSEPFGRSMVATARVMDHETAVDYELLIVEQTEDGVQLRLVHFGPGLADKGGPKSAYRLESLEPNEAIFAAVGDDPVRRIGYRRSGDELVVTLERSDSREPLQWRYERVR